MSIRSSKEKVASGLRSNATGGHISSLENNENSRSILVNDLYPEADNWCVPSEIDYNLIMNIEFRVSATNFVQ